jgi:hypothetical protein
MAHIHVSISESSTSSNPTSPTAGGSTNTAPVGEAQGSSCESAPVRGEPSGVGLAFFVGVAAFVGTGAALCMALRKRWQFSLHTSQLLFICAAIWVYLLLCHGLPAFFQAMRVLTTRSASDAGPFQDRSHVTLAASGMAPADETSSSASTAASGPGLSMMAPTLPPTGDGAAAAASVLTQRR